MKLLLCLLLYGSIAQATIYLTITGANVKRAKIAVGKMHPLGGEGSQDLAREMQSLLLWDLELMNVFEFMSESLYRPLDTASIYQMKYEEWAPLGAAFVLKLGYRVDGSTATVEALLYDVPGQKKIFANRYQNPISQSSRIVHTLAEDILQAITGEKGLFFSRILMVCRDLKRRKSPPKDIYISDPDGKNFTQLTSDETLSLSPSWVNDGKNITYTQFVWMGSGRARKRGVALKKHNLSTGDRETISAKDGMNSGATWSADGKRMALTLSFAGRPEIYLTNATGGEAEPFSRNLRWQKFNGGFESTDPMLLFDVEPDWSPDGKNLVFSSARSGKPMIYVADVMSRTARRLTFAGQYNASPSWSPRGDKILFAAQKTGSGNFDIYMIDPDGGNLSRITDGTSEHVNSENPTWAPTGRHFAYGSNESGQYAVYVTSLDGFGKRRISPSDKECMTPAWGAPEG